MVLFKSRNPPTFPGIPDVSVWLGLQRAEAIVDTRIGAPSVQPFGCAACLGLLPFPSLQLRLSCRTENPVLHCFMHRGVQHWCLIKGDVPMLSGRYDQTLICHELCQQLHDGGVKAVQVLYFSSAALVVAATLSAVGLASLPEHIKLPEAARAVRRRCSSASMASTASGTAVLLALCGMLSWFLMLRSLQQGADGNSAAGASNSHGIHIDEDEEMHLGER